MVDTEKYILDRLNSLKSKKRQLMIQANKPDGASNARITELNTRIHELQRLQNKTR